jgi:hypothetical protein
MSNRTYRALLLISLTAFLADPVGAAFDKGGITGVGGRPLGMGGAFVTVADDPSAIYYNPAGLVQILRPEVYGMGAALLNGKQFFANLAYVQPFSDQLIWSLSTTQLFHTGGVKSAERVYYLTFASPLSVDKSMSMGLNFKFYTVDSELLPEFRARGMGVDMGFLYHLPIPSPSYGKQINLGLFVDDLDTTLRWENGAKDKIPTRVRGGFSYEFTDDLLSSFELETFEDPNLAGSNPTRLHAGIEGWFFEDRLGLRTGYQGFQTLSGRFTAGISYRSRTWGIDYAFIGHPQFLGSSHRISGSWRFGRSVFGGAKSFIPEGVTAYTDGDIITLRWSGSSALSLDGYNVYYSKTSGMDFTKVNTNKVIKTNYYAVQGLEKNTRYYFVVTSVTSTKPAMESQYSREVVVVTTTAPSAPSVEQGELEKEGVVDIGRQANMANTSSFPDPAKSNLRGYNIYMSEVAEGRYEKITTQPIGNVPTYLVRKLKVGRRYYFKFTSVALDGSESAMTKPFPTIALPYAAVVQQAGTALVAPTPTPAKK